MIEFLFPEESELRPPFSFREKGQAIEGEVGKISDVLRMFEAMDVLGGVLELIDQDGKVVTIHSRNNQDVEQNEYHNPADLYLKVKPSSK